ncbi:MAG: acetyl-CoA carboxylase, carboxyltransferase subunit beta, partial [Deferribacterota bacterium]|nr:acetyl-CoA carboxylase, carboxyltransferase subunit beta [Deferribacterota bacterium]
LKSILFDQIKKVTGLTKKEIKENIWIKCEKCKEISYRNDIINNFHTCPICGYHFKIDGRQKIDIIVDEGSFKEVDSNLYSLDPLKFKDTKRYADRLKSAIKKTGLNEAFISGTATVYGKEVHIGAFEFKFLGGSMGSVVGEKITRLFERAIKNRTHVITISCSGGARMQESILSLMQMAKTSAVLKKLEKERLAHISILTNPTTGGVTASFAMLGDSIIAEPGALIGFAGPRVIEQTTRQKLPEGFQTAEFLLEHGMVDMVLHRNKWREVINNLLDFYGTE